MLRSWRVSERWGPIAPVRRVERYRDEEPAEREWIRYIPTFETRSSYSKEEAVASALDWSDAALYNESGYIRQLEVHDLGRQLDLEV